MKSDTSYKKEPDIRYNPTYIITGNYSEAIGGYCTLFFLYTLIYFKEFRYICLITDSNMNRFLMLNYN